MYVCVSYYRRSADSDSVNATPRKKVTRVEVRQPYRVLSINSEPEATKVVVNESVTVASHRAVYQHAPYPIHPVGFTNDY